MCITLYTSYERRKPRINNQDGSNTTHPQSHDCVEGYIDRCDNHFYQGFNENHQFR